ncbi:MAG: M13 family metallopeptidase [Urechidicola sp.]|nr:M13 family metallopeptidase [Urechidicola sp.]
MNTKYFKAGLLTLAISAAITLVSCEKEEKAPEVPGIDLANLDQKESPKNDFYRFVNGGWEDSTEIPSDRVRWGTFDELRKKTDEDVMAVLKDAMNSEVLKDAQTVGTVSDQQKAINYFETILDTVSRDTQGIDPLKPYLAKIDQIANVEDLQEFLTEMEPYGGVGFFGVGVGSHPENSDLNTGFLSATGLGIARDYYLDDDDDTKEKREKYKAHIAKMLQYLGDSSEEAKANAVAVLAFETSLASPRMSKEDARDRRKQNNPRSIEDLNKMASSINWAVYFDSVGMKNIDTIIVSDPKYIIAMDAILKENKVDDWKNYLRWSLIDRDAGKLTTEIDRVNWEFYGKVLTGAEQQRKRDERALAAVNGGLGEALGKLYVEKHFPPEAKAKAMEMIDNILLAFEDRIKNLEWMSDETKEKALVKLSKMTVKIGYPDPEDWEDYSALELEGKKDGGSYFKNAKNLAKWGHDEAMAKLGKEVDKDKWIIVPQVVNAGYMPPYNQIIFPAGILQPPFFNWQADEAVNYGGIGAGIGHEISHAFDDSGSRYDGDGNLVNWWTDEDLEKFTALGQKIVAQYDAVEVLPGVNVNGEFTLGENIGDIGGISAAYDGLQIYLTKNGRPEDIDGFSPEQRFFMSWGTIWRSKSKDDALRDLIKRDPHSPAMIRATMSASNTDEFFEAFNIVEGDSMYVKPADRVKIW